MAIDRGLEAKSRALLRQYLRPDTAAHAALSSNGSLRHLKIRLDQAAHAVGAALRQPTFVDAAVSGDLGVRGSNPVSDPPLSEFDENRLTSIVQSQVRLLMDEKGLSKRELATRLDVSIERARAVLRDKTTNMTLRTVARMYHQLGEEVVISSRGKLPEACLPTVSADQLKRAVIALENADQDEIFPVALPHDAEVSLWAEHLTRAVLEAVGFQIEVKRPFA